MKAIKKACGGASLYPKSSSVSSKLKAGGKIKKLQSGGGGKAKKKYVDRMNTADSLFAASDRQIKDGNYLNMISNKPDWNRPLLTIGRENREKAEKLKNQKPLGPTRFKIGGTVKAKDGKWMQKVSASIKKRGTAGKCTPITKPGCTGRAKALAKTFKKIAKSNKKK